MLNMSLFIYLFFILHSGEFDSKDEKYIGIISDQNKLFFLSMLDISVDNGYVTAHDHLPIF